VSLLDPFLTKYQTNDPFMAFLYGDLSSLLVKKIIKKEHIPTDNLKKLISVDLLIKSIFLPLEKVDIGFETKFFKKSAANGKDKTLFISDCQNFLKIFCLLNR